MAGEISIPMTLTAMLLSELAQAGLALTVQVDCSHARFVRTLRPDRPGQPIITKPIELDCALSLNGLKTYDQVVNAMQGARTTSNLFKFYTALNGMGMPGTPTHGLQFLKQRNLKIEFPNFDTTIINLAAPPLPIRHAINACNAATVADFNALPAHERLAMGMYLRRTANDFALTKAAEPQPRIAVD